VLMDVQMPEMDGFTATRLIRQDPALGKLIVIAMTANATPEDRERCLAAGMDDFITKPVMPDRLYAVLAKWLSGPADNNGPPPWAPAATPGGEPPLIDLAVLGRMVNNSPEKIRKYAEKFVITTRDALASLDAALAAGNMDVVAEIGHKIKSSARGVGALHFGDLCQHLENLRRQDDAAQARAVVGQLHTLLGRIAEKVSAECGTSA
jgi:two-component system, sensor histidine kinase and response regulator